MSGVTTTAPITPALVRQCLAKLGCAPAEFAARHLFVSPSVLNRILAGQKPSPSLEMLLNDLARRLGVLASG